MKLRLIKTEKGMLLEGVASGEELEYYDVDGEGGKATKISFAPWNEKYSAVPGVATAEYAPEDADTFWGALETVLKSARAAGISLPEHAAY